jgi:hypothetical protein
VGPLDLLDLRRPFIVDGDLELESCSRWHLAPSSSFSHLRLFGSLLRVVLSDLQVDRAQGRELVGELVGLTDRELDVTELQDQGTDPLESCLKEEIPGEPVFR